MLDPTRHPESDFDATARRLRIVRRFLARDAPPSYLWLPTLITRTGGECFVGRTLRIAIYEALIVDPDVVSRACWRRWGWRLVALCRLSRSAEYMRKN